LSGYLTRAVLLRDRPEHKEGSAAAIRVELSGRNGLQRDRRVRELLSGELDQRCDQVRRRGRAGAWHLFPRSHGELHCPLVARVALQCERQNAERSGLCAECTLVPSASCGGGPAARQGEIEQARHDRREEVLHARVGEREESHEQR
jgi:hypothetical protein